MACFSNLPTEIVSMIMQQVQISYHPISDPQLKNILKKYVFINKQFYEATIPLIWASVTIITKRQADTFFTNVTELKPTHVRYIKKLSYYHIRSDRNLLLLLPHFVRLTHLTIQSANYITDTSIRQIPRYCPNIKSITLVDALINNQSLQTLAEHCAHLTDVHVYKCPGLNGDLFSALSACSSTLTTLDIEVAGSTEGDWLTMNVTYLLLAATRLKQLTTFRLMYAPSAFLRWLLIVLAKKNSTTPSLDNDDDSHSTQRPSQDWILQPSYPQPWPHLVNITLDSRDRNIIGDKELIALMQARPGLTDLSFSGTNVTDDTLNTMGALLNDLQSLCILNSRHITARGVRRLVQWCPLLHRADFTGCENLYNYHFPELQVRPCSLRRRVEVLNKVVMDLIRICEGSDPGEFPRVRRRGRGRRRGGSRIDIHDFDDYGDGDDAVIFGDHYGNYWEDIDPSTSWLWQLFRMYR